MSDKLPTFTVVMRTVALNEADRQWVPLRRGKYHLYEFPDWDAAETFMLDLQRRHSHLDLKVVPVEWTKTPQSGP